MNLLTKTFLFNAATLLLSTIGSIAAETPQAAEASANTNAQPAAANAQPAAAADTAENDLVVMPPVRVEAPRVANETPANSFAMPVTLLRYDPVVDVQARSISETQADISIRGGTFENTGFTLEGIPLYAPQTGHYAAELPISPKFLGAPEVRTGAANAISGWNATAGSIAYSWLPVTEGGSVSATLGERRLFGAEAHAALLSKEKILGRKLAVELSVAHSRGDGPFGNEPRRDKDGNLFAGDEAPFSDHSFQRHNLHLQQRDAHSQTDVFLGYQTKDYAWPNLYAKGTPSPLWRDEREDVRTQLYAFNHRQEFANGDFLRLGASYALNKDHYTIPLLTTYHARHSTTALSASVDGRKTLLTSNTASTALRYRTALVADSIRSNTLTVGRYNSRTLFTAALLGEQTLNLGSSGDTLQFAAGGTLDEANRERGAISPAASIEWKNNNPKNALRRASIDYSESTQLPTYMALNSPPNGLFGGNAKLGRARARNAQLSADFTPEGSAGWTITPALFFRQDLDLVDWIFDYATAGSRRALPVDINTYGAELTARHSWQRLDLSLGYTFLHKEDSYTSPITGSFYAMNYAKHRLTAAVILRLPYNLEIHWDNELRIQEKNRLRTGTDTPLLSSLSLHWRVPSFDHLTLSAQVDNLWDSSYQDVPLVPSAPRTFSVHAEYRW